MLGLTPEMIVFIGVFLGSLSRTLIPYLAILKSNPSIKFEWKYAVTFGVAIFESLLVTMLSFSAVPTELFSLSVTQLFAFIAAFGWAYSTNDVFNRIISAQTPIETTSTSNPPTVTTSSYSKWAFQPSILKDGKGMYMRQVFINGIFRGQQLSETDPETDPFAKITDTTVYG